jgi:hypothetical protein
MFIGMDAEAEVVENDVAATHDADVMQVKQRRLRHGARISGWWCQMSC